MEKTNNIIFEDDMIRIKIEPHEIPWLKIFSKQQEKEFSECPQATRQHIWVLLDLIEREMIEFYQPEKINIASFANYLPQVHWHIMARFKEDSYFPETVWGTKQRESKLDLPDISLFIEKLLHSIR